ncbi:MAG: hypothetical protein ACTSVY_00735 [Candidatus Helarchaeota archaeon]
MVHAITQIFSTALVLEISLFFLFSKKRKIGLIAMFSSAPLGWILEIISINLGFWDYSISIVPIFGFPLPIWLGWVFTMWYSALIITHLIDFITNDKLMKGKSEKKQVLYSWLFCFLMYSGPVSWGILIIMPWFYLFNAVMQNTIFLNDFSWVISDYFGLNIFQYLFWIGLMAIGTFILAYFLIKIKKSDYSKIKFISSILISAAILTPLGWGIEFFGVNSHSPIWSYATNQPLLIFGPLNIPLLVYFGWFLILAVCMYVIFKNSTFDIFLKNEISLKKKNK